MADVSTDLPASALKRRDTAHIIRATDSAAEQVAGTVAGLGIAMLIVAMPVFAHGISPVLGMGLAVTMATACAWRMPHLSIVAVICGFLFQNLFVSLASDLVRSDDDFDIIRAYNFLILSVTWVVTAVRFIHEIKSHDPAMMPYVKVSTAMMVAIGVYFLIGFAINGIPAVVYLRNIVTPLLLFQVCLVLFARHPVRLGPTITAAGLLTLACGAVEFFNRDAWLTWTNGYGYWALAGEQNWQALAFDKRAAETGEVVVSLLDTFKIDFFNSPLMADLGIEMSRLFGPNMHAISFAYALVFFVIFALFRGRWIQAGLLFVLLFLCNAKGPLILLILVGGGWLVFRLFGAGFAFIVIGAAAFFYAIAGVAIGLSVGDFHVLGLMSALHEFPRNPLGYGLGSGGNLSPMFTSINWHDAQADGRTPFPVESSVGVLLYQMGIFALLLIGCYSWVAWRVMRVARITGNDLHAATSLGLIAMIANGLFQEEAYFSPLALALFLALAGMILGAALRSSIDCGSGPARQ